MAQLLFYDEGHIYEVDGERLPSVSEVLRFISREEYADINQYTLDNAADRGKSVHKACEQIIKFGECEITDDIAGYVRAFMKFCKEHQCKFTHCEKALACEDYAGTLDLGGIVDGKLSIVDIKTVSTVKKTLVKAQLNGYKRLYEHNKLGDVESLYCLQLMKDGKYRLYPVGIDSTVFDCCLTMHKSMSAKHERGKIN